MKYKLSTKAELIDLPNDITHIIITWSDIRSPFNKRILFPVIKPNVAKNSIRMRGFFHIRGNWILRIEFLKGPKSLVLYLIQNVLWIGWRFHLTSSLFKSQQFSVRLHRNRLNSIITFVFGLSKNLSFSAHMSETDLEDGHLKPILFFRSCPFLNLI